MIITTGKILAALVTFIVLSALVSLLISGFKPGIIPTYSAYKLNLALTFIIPILGTHFMLKLVRAYPADFSLKVFIRDSLVRLGLTGEKALHWLVLLFGLGIALYLLNSQLAAIIQQHFEVSESMKLLEKIFAPTGHPLDTLGAFVTVALVGPIAEEVMCRGWIQRSIQNRWHGSVGAWAALIIQAVIFSVMHGNLVQGPPAFIAGLVLGWLAMRTGSLLAPIIIHILNNLFNMIALYFILPPGAPMDVGTEEFLPPEILVVAALMLIISLVYGARVFPSPARPRFH